MRYNEKKLFNSGVIFFAVLSVLGVFACTATGTGGNNDPNPSNGIGWKLTPEADKSVKGNFILTFEFEKPIKDLSEKNFVFKTADTGADITSTLTISDFKQEESDIGVYKMNVSGVYNAVSIRVKVVVSDSLFNPERHDWKIETNTPGEGVMLEYGDIGPGGGIIFGMLSPEQKADYGVDWTYLEVGAISTTPLAWASANYLETAIEGAKGVEIGTGRANTQAILAVDADAPAAKYCADYRGGELDDWFLPSLKELGMIWKNKNTVPDFWGDGGSGGAAGPEGDPMTYWASSQCAEAKKAWIKYICNGTISGGSGSDFFQFENDKNNNYLYHVIPVRTF
jgi:hypothetical protein